MRRYGKALALLWSAVALGSPPALDGQNGEDGGGIPVITDPMAAPVPFGPGERLTYKVKLGIFSVGEGSMSVEGIDTVRGRPAYHLRWDVEGGVPFARIEDHFQSWLDTHTLVSRRFIQDIHEIDYERLRHYEFYPEARRYEMVEGGEPGEMPTSMPLDDIAFIYFARTLPLEVGATYSFNRYFKDSGNPVVIKVLRRERVKVPAGEFNTVVVQPIIQTDGIFGEGGEAEIYFTDDDRKLLVMMKSSVPVVGSISLKLKELEEGVPLNPRARSSSGAAASR